MTRIVSSAFVVSALMLGSSAMAQQQGQAQEQQGLAQVRELHGSPAVQLDQHQTPLITVLYAPQGQQTRITALVSSPQQPGQERQIHFDGQYAQNRVVRFEGQAGGPGQRILFTAKSGERDAKVEQLFESEGLVVLGVVREDPQEQLAAQQQQAQQQQQAEQAQQDQQGQAQAGQPQQDQGDQAQQAGAQQQGQQGQQQQVGIALPGTIAPAGAGQQDAQAQQQDAQAQQQDGQAQQAADQQQRDQQAQQQQQQEPKRDRYDAIVTVFKTTGR
jgi:flagellar biosynthesis GTPase FlhF